MLQPSRTVWIGLTMLVVLSLMLTACEGAGAPTQVPVTTQPTLAPTRRPTKAPQPTQEPSEVPTATATTASAPTPLPTEAPPFVSRSSGKRATSGFECPAPANPVDVKSKEVNLFVWTEYVPQDIFDCFEAVYGVKVNRTEYSSDEEMYAGLNEHPGTYDVVLPTDYIVGQMLRQGMVEKLDKSKLPALQYFDPNYLNLAFDPGNIYTIPYQAGTDSIVYNADKVKNPPKSYADLWNSEFVNSGRMIVLDDSRAIIGVTLLTLGYDVNTLDPIQLDAAETKLAELVKGIKQYDSDSPKTALMDGDVDLGITWTGDAELAHRENPAITFVYPTEGPIIWQDNYAIPKDAPHMDAAYAWLNYSMQPDVFWLMLRDFPYTNPNKAALDFARTSHFKIQDQNGQETTPAELYQAYMDSPITNTPPEVLKMGHRIEDVDEAKPLYDMLWTKVTGR